MISNHMFAFQTFFIQKRCNKLYYNTAQKALFPIIVASNTSLKNIWLVIYISWLGHRESLAESCTFNYRNCVQTVSRGLCYDGIDDFSLYVVCLYACTVLCCIILVRIWVEGYVMTKRRFQLVSVYFLL